MFTDSGGVQHYGSLYTDADYISKVHSLYATIGFIPVNRLSLTLTGTLAQSQASYETIEMPEPEEALEHLDYTFDEMHTYSDLEYFSYQINAGLAYAFYNGLEWTLDISYYDLDDKEGYVYGDESGSIFIVRSGVQIGF